MNGLDLFSGIGGITYALQDWIRPVAYCEIDPFCQSVLLQRMSEGNLPKAPIWDDIRTLYSGELPIYGGFPCQDISVAGAGKGLEGERSGLFFEIVRLAKEIKPQFLFLENVPAITTRGGLRVVREVAEMGYDCRWCVISAAGVGALHRRERWFLLAHSNNDGASSGTGGGIPGERIISRERQEEQEKGFRETQRASDVSLDVSHSKSKRLEGLRGSTEREVKEQSKSSLHGQDDGNANSIPSREANTRAVTQYIKSQAWGEYSGLYRPFKSRDDWQKIVSEMGKCSDGLPHQVDRLKALGNAVVPQQVRKSFEILAGKL